jgi:hypothetical protein
MPELGPYGSVRGARGNSRPYRDPRPLVDTPTADRRGTFRTKGETLPVRRIVVHLRLRRAF